MSNDDWLQMLKVGDEVAIARGGWAVHYRFARVARLTATQIIVGTDRFRLRDGREVGVSRHADYLVQATAELKAELAQEQKRRELLNRVSDVKWREQSDGTLAAIVSILDGANKVTE